MAPTKKPTDLLLPLPVWLSVVHHRYRLITYKVLLTVLLSGSTRTILQSGKLSGFPSAVHSAIFCQIYLSPAWIIFAHNFRQRSLVYIQLNFWQFAAFWRSSWISHWHSLSNRQIECAKYFLQNYLWSFVSFWQENLPHFCFWDKLS